MTVDECYNLILYITSKNLQQGYISPSDFDTVINQAQNSFMDYLLGEFQSYQYGKPVARVEFGQNAIIRQRLTPIIYGYILNPDSTGFAPYPGDFQQVDTMWSDIYNYRRARYVQQDSLYSYLHSVITPVATHPIYLIEQDGFRFFPNNIGQTKMSYVQTPPIIKWGYTLDINGMPVYAPSQSVDPIWFDTDLLEIISRALAMIGVNLQTSVISQYANEITKGGQ